MTNQQIVEKAIAKAVAGGWQPFKELQPVRLEKWEKGGMVIVAVLNEKSGGEIEWYREIEGIIFNHDFAKALWGDVFVFHSKTPNWQHHLQQMVIADDPIAYLGANI